MNAEFDEVSDEALIRAIRKRLLSEIAAKEAISPITQNIYGGAIGQGGGVMDQLGGADGGGMSPEDMDYFVDIVRKDLPEVNPETGKPMGWEKNVHRYRKKKATP